VPCSQTNLLHVDVKQQKFDSTTSVVNEYPSERRLDVLGHPPGRSA
jgi:hypothetical protein